MGVWEVREMLAARSVCVCVLGGCWRCSGRGVRVHCRLSIFTRSSRSSALLSAASMAGWPCALTSPVNGFAFNSFAFFVLPFTHAHST
jgi:hypothetical protein